MKKSERDVLSSQTESHKESPLFWVGAASAKAALDNKYLKYLGSLVGPWQEMHIERM